MVAEGGQFLRPGAGFGMALTPLEKAFLVLGCESGDDVRGDAFFMNRLVAGREIFGRGQADGRAIAAWDNGLHGAFSEGGFAHDQGAFQVLQGSGREFGSAGANG